LIGGDGDALLRDAGFAARVVVLGYGFLCARVWLTLGLKILIDSLIGWLIGIARCEEG